MNWKRAALSNIRHGIIVRVASNITVSSHGNLIDPDGRYRTFDGGSVALVSKGSLGIVADRNIHIVSSHYLEDNIGRIENGDNPPAFNPVEIGSLLKDTTHIIRINHHILNDLETLT